MPVLSIYTYNSLGLINKIEEDTHTERRIDTDIYIEIDRDSDTEIWTDS